MELTVNPAVAAYEILESSTFVTNLADMGWSIREPVSALD